MVVFSGAGISTESGIPDFRGPDGIWKKIRPTTIQEYIASKEVRQRQWAGKKASYKQMHSAEPNKGHLAVAKFYRAGRLLGVVTQNIDGLHQSSGVPPEAVVELHGSTLFVKCLSCRYRENASVILDQMGESNDPPDCPQCGGMLKSGTISFGENLDPLDLDRAEELSNTCDLYLVLGSSLVVSPANMFPVMAKKAGAKLIIINNEPTPLDELADLVIHEAIGEVLPPAIHSAVS